MNIFAKSSSYAKAAQHMGMTIEAVQQAVAETRTEATNPEAEAEGKASRQTEDLYTATNEFVHDVPYGIREAFARSLANKTAGMTEGETRTIYVVGYIFKAEGYMKGHIIAPYTNETKSLLEDNKNIYDKINQDKEIAPVWTEAVRNAEGRSGSNSNIFEGRRSSADDRLLDKASERNASGDNERVWTNPRTEEEIHEIVNKVRIMYGLDPVDYSKQGKASRKLDLEDFDYSQISNMRVEANKVREEITKIEKSEEFKALMDKITQAVDSGDVEGGIKAYNEWKKSSRYGDLIAKRDQLEADIAKYSKAYEENRVNHALNEEEEAIKKSGLSEADYFRKEAEKVFGYTPYFYDAGYIVPNGKMLNFSGEKGKHFGSRGEDHRAIGQIYANTQGGKALTRFMNDGNIRIMAESPGVDISSTVEPTKEQYATIKNFLYDYAKEEYFNIDLSDENGRVVGSLEYEGKINPTRVINDIKHYYETGEIKSQSQVDKFRYSREPNLIDNINELAGEESDAELTRVRRLQR